MDSSDTAALVEQLAQRLIDAGWQLATAESCTGGLIAAACTELAGSSQWFERGFVTYSNAAKHELLGVPQALIATHGAVSQAVALAMAQGAAARAQVPLALSVTGIAGPTGGSPDKPVGTVWLGWCVAGTLSAACVQLSGDRHAVRQLAVAAALRGLLARLPAVKRGA